jgi:hypothetical protein
MMKVRRNTVPGKYLWIIFFVLLGLSSCKTARVIPTTALIVKPISTNKLIRNIENNAFDYKHLSVKKITCQFDNGKTKTSFRASIQAEKDKQIILNLTKLNIPVGRLWLTPDSVKFINYLEDSYLLDDYSYLSSMLDMDLNFQTVNAIISNNVFSFRDEKRDKDNHEYDATIDSGMYVLQSVKNLKTAKVNKKISAKKLARRSRKLVEGAPVRQLLYVDPVTFKLRKIKMEDAVNSRSVNIEFSDFVEVGKQLYPGEIFLHFLSPENNMQMRIKLSNFSLDDEKGIRFKVPEKFTRMNHE